MSKKTLSYLGLCLVCVIVVNFIILKPKQKNTSLTTLSAQSENGSLLKRTIDDTFCSHETNGIGKSKGLKIKLFYPCEWEILDGERKSIVIKFQSKETEAYMAASNLVINEFPKILSKEQIEYFTSFEGIRKTFASSGELTTVEQTTIDGLEAAEFTLISTIAPEVISYTLHYYIPYRDRGIALTYAAIARSQKEAKRTFDLKINQFKILAHKTKIRVAE